MPWDAGEPVELGGVQVDWQGWKLLVFFWFREERELVTSKKRERGIMGTSIERERGVMGWKKREKGNQRWRLEMSAIFSG